MKALIHVLKIHDVESVIRLKNANGLSKRNTRVIIYLRENVNTKFISPILENDFTIPENENKSVASGTQNREELRRFKNSENEIVLWVKSVATDNR